MWTTTDDEGKPTVKILGLIKGQHWINQRYDLIYESGEVRKQLLERFPRLLLGAAERTIARPADCRKPTPPCIDPRLRRRVTRKTMVSDGALQALSL